MTDALHVILALLQILLFAASLSAIVYVHSLRKEVDGAVSKCNNAADNCRAEAYGAVLKAEHETTTAVEKCVSIAKVLEQSHNTSIEAIKRLDAKVDDVNHKLMANNMRSVQGRM